MDKKPLIVIAGPTASGKTALSVEIAKYLNTDIISADSMQIYKKMDIGTAKPSIDEMCGITHYMIDEVEPDELFNVAEYAERAKKYMRKIYSDGHIPVMVGGTGLYIDTVVQNINLIETDTDYELRKKLEEEAKIYGNEHLHNKLKEVDLFAAENIHPNNLKRVIRALEIYYQTGKTSKEIQTESRCEESPYDVLMFVLEWDRERLYERIDKRVDIMINNGLLKEAISLIKMGYDRDLTSMQAIGYSEIIDYSRGLSTLDEAISLIKRNSRRYAKRQITWFKRNKDAIWLNGEDKNLVNVAIEIINKHYNLQ